MKIKFKRLDYQEKCLNQILGVFKGIDLRESENDAQRISNPVFETEALKNILLENIQNLRSEQKITQGSVGIDKSLNCDILMETGTGKTFCFLECVYALHQNYHLSKFIVLVPSNAIKLGVLKSVEITREFFKSEYSVHLESYENTESFILASNHKCCVLVMTFSAFNKEKNTINKSCLENITLFNGAKSYMQALASMRPIVIMDEPHRFLGDKTKKYLEQLNALVTLRFGATFKDDYNNLIYALDSKKAFDCALVKSISVASVGESQECFLELKETNKKQNEYEATISYTNLENKTQSVKVKKHDNLGALTQISALEDYIVENITKTEARFLNGFNLLLDQKEPFSHLLEGEQEVMLKEAIKSHFEREEGLFKKGIKALCMVFISGVNSYLSENEKPAKLALLFEKLYQQELEEVLKKPLDENYRAYLERTKDAIQKVHGGYFAKSKKESDEAQVIALILKEKEKLLSFDSDLKKIPNIKKKIQEYKDLVAQYKDPNPLYPLNKADLINKIQDLKNTFSLTLKDPKTKAELEKTIEKHIKKYNFFALDDKSLLDGLNYIIPSLFGTPKLSPKEEEEAFASYGCIRALRKKLDDALSGGEYHNAFEWRFEFPEVLDDEGNFLGFDCIIGNPPYIRQEQIKPLKPLLQKQYQDFYNSTADIYTYFFALAYHLLKEKGFNAFITSNKYARVKYGAKLREWLLKKTTIVSYMELNALKVFESATVDTSIMSFIKQTPPKESDFKYYEPTPNDKDDLKSTPSLLMRQNALSTESFIFANATLLDLRDKIESVGTPLKDYDIQINCGIKTGANEAFIIPTEKRNAILNACKTQEERKHTEALIKPILRGKDIKRYSYEWAGEWVINTHNGYTSALKSKIPPVDIEKYPAIKAHLDSHFDTIATRSDQGDTPYHLRNCAYLEDFEKEKIVYGEIVQEPRFYLDNGKCELGYFYAEATSFILTGEHLRYLLGMLHSKLITFAFKTFYAGGGLCESGYRYQKAFIERLPIPKITPQNQELADKITDGAKAILEAKEKDPKANTLELEKEIDALVYQLYHLTDEEIKIIEDGQ
ncbi:hypothetical protein KKKH26_00810 [Helicobacter pylori]